MRRAVKNGEIEVIPFGGLQRIPPREIERIRHVLGIETDQPTFSQTPASTLEQRAARRDVVKPPPLPLVKRKRGRPRKQRAYAEETEHHA